MPTAVHGLPRMYSGRAASASIALALFTRSSNLLRAAPKPSPETLAAAFSRSSLSLIMLLKSAAILPLARSKLCSARSIMVISLFEPQVVLHRGDALDRAGDRARRADLRRGIHEAGELHHRLVGLDVDLHYLERRLVEDRLLHARGDAAVVDVLAGAFPGRGRRAARRQQQRSRNQNSESPIHVDSLGVAVDDAIDDLDLVADAPWGCGCLGDHAVRAVVEAHRDLEALG